MMFWVYILKSKKDGRFYKKMSQDVDKRLIQYNKGENRSTKGFRLWTLVYKKGFENRQDARNYEKFLKSGAGREFIKNHSQ